MLLKNMLSLHCVFHSIRFKVNKVGLSGAHFFLPIGELNLIVFISIVIFFHLIGVILLFIYFQ